MDSEGLTELIELLLFTRVDEDEGSSFFASAGSAAAAVRVVVDLLGELVVDDEGEALDIDSARGDVGSDEELSAFFFEGSHDFVALELGEVALQNADRMAALGEFFAKNIGTVTGAGEDETALGTLTVEEFVDEIGLVLFDTDGESMIDVAVDDVFGVDLDRLGIGRHAELDEVIEGTRERSGEEPGRFAVHADLDSGADLILETHGEHFVGFVEDEILHVVESHGLALEEVIKTAGSGDEDVGGALEAVNLDVDFISAGGYFEEDPLLGVFGELEEGLVDLFGELTGGSENEPLDLLFLGVDFGEKREAKGGGFSGSSLGLRHEVVPALEKVGEGLGLHRGGLPDA